MANNAALQFSVSKMVSTIKISAPPSTKPRICSKYEIASWSKLTLRAAGSLTSGEMLAVFGVGPNAPATKRGLSGVEYWSQAARASLADCTFIS